MVSLVILFPIQHCELWIDQLHDTSPICQEDNCDFQHLRPKTNTVQSITCHVLASYASWERKGVVRRGTKPSHTCTPRWTCSCISECGRKSVFIKFKMQACLQQYGGAPEAVTSDRCCSQPSFQQARRISVSEQMQFGFAPSMKEKKYSLENINPK